MFIESNLCFYHDTITLVVYFCLKKVNYLVGLVLNEAGLIADFKISKQVVQSTALSVINNHRSKSSVSQPSSNHSQLQSQNTPKTGVCHLLLTSLTKAFSIIQ